MLGTCHNLQIFRSIVGSNTIDMMHDLGGKQWPTNCALCNPDVLTPLTTRPSDGDIALGVQMPGPLVVSATSNGAKPTLALPIPRELPTALVADSLNGPRPTRGGAIRSGHARSGAVFPWATSATPSSGNREGIAAALANKRHGRFASSRVLGGHADLLNRSVCLGSGRNPDPSILPAIDRATG